MANTGESSSSQQTPTTIIPVPSFRMLALQQNPTRQQLTDTSQGNFWLFRCDASHKDFHDKFGPKRAISDCSYFLLPINHTLSEWETDFINSRQEYWKWTKLVGLSCEGNAFVTRLFYVNIIVNTPSEEFGFTTHILGH